MVYTLYKYHFMNNVEYSKIYTKLTKGLSPKTKDILDRRFGIKPVKNAKFDEDQIVKTETLESIGKSLGITRERVRQIEEAGFSFIRKNHQETLHALFAELTNYFDQKGGLKREDIALQDLGHDKNKPYVLFLLTLGNQFSRVCGKKDYHYFWSTIENTESKAKEVLGGSLGDIQTHGALLTKQELAEKFAPKFALHPEALNSYLEISKKIQENKEGKIGLVDWPEIKPRGVKDKAFLVFKKHAKPLHFRQIAELIDQLENTVSQKKAHPQTVHNELIKDKRFVLVGRGMYALSEWGYTPGTIKDVINKILTQKQQPVGQEDLVKEVLSQRLVAKNTVLINLNNKKHFQRNPEGKYLLRETQIS